MSQGNHSYKRWKWVEIVNETEARVLMEFVHPSYSTQKIYLNDRKEHMIEVLMHRSFFYVKEQIPGQPAHMIKWRLIRRIFDYPMELQSEDQMILNYFSPCFQRYMVLDKKTKQFVIKDTVTDQFVKKVPKDLMTYTDVDHVIETLNRFKWVNISTFLIVNEEGIEKLVDIDNDFKEIEFNYRPLFTEIDS